MRYSKELRKLYGEITPDVDKFLEEGDPTLDRQLKNRIITLLTRTSDTIEKELLQLIDVYVRKNFESKNANEIMKSLKSGHIHDWLEHMANDPSFMKRVMTTLF